MKKTLWFAIDSILLIPLLVFVAVVWGSVTAWKIGQFGWAAVKEVWR